MGKTDVRSDSLVEHLHASLADSRAPRHHLRVHASDLDPGRGWCPREAILLEETGLKRKREFVATSTATMFGFGNKAADIVIEALPDEVVWGNWECVSCGWEVKLSYRPCKCPGCGGRQRALAYREVLLKPVEDDPVNATGSCDVMLDLRRDGTKTLVEIKSEGSDAFRARTAAEWPHVWRTSLYLKYASETPWLRRHRVDTTSAIILYVCKSSHVKADAVAGYGFYDWRQTPYKEYRVPRSDAILTEPLRRLEQLRDAVRAMRRGEPYDYPARVCENASCTRARNCPVRAACFGQAMVTGARRDV